MRLSQLIAAVHEGIDVAAAMADVAEVARHDRYQASAGILAAAGYVAQRAADAGLRDVTVHTFPADGARRWWTYQAPMSWTPVRASLRHSGETLIDYPAQPYTLAAYSAPTRAGGVAVPLLRWSAMCAGADATGTLVLLDDVRVPFPECARRAAAGGAVAVAADPLSARTDRFADQVGRLELLPGTALAGFSLTAAQLTRLSTAADRGEAVTVEVAVAESTADMPVVTGVLPGDGGGDEFLLSAHLCHPRPSANDNASGVAALLATARLLGARPAGGPDLRFLWAPEFVGVAAYLHDLVGSGAVARPSLAVNVDMAGQDPYRCGSSLMIERGPDDVPSFLPALAERCADLMPARARSYSGAVPCEPGETAIAPFSGGSDHALVSDAPTGCPTVSFGHWPDRTNHTSADTLDMVDPAELRRTITVAASTVAAVRGRADPALAADVADACAGWAAGHILAALPGRRRTPAPYPYGDDGSPVLDPASDAASGRRVAHCGEIVGRCVGTLTHAGVPAGEIVRTAHWLADVSATAADRAAAARATAAGRERALGAEPSTADEGSGTVLARAALGPVNPRSLAATAADRAWLAEHLAEDRGGSHARVLTLLRAVDGRRGRRSAAWWAALASELPISVAFADRVFDMLHRAGWVVPVLNPAEDLNAAEDLDAARHPG
ncbi:peptidase M28-like protein [Micromonospora sp. Llam0]|uniref:DUF4910 domain-containing protein n=1 Tax=Micromonospora sp. Llam0 TaxID=2485143 RepID=UPI000F47A3B9|nr:DUF4910 domain-containing protein [Micromonospora sp. Llam0]ROO63348.1 peptidase M28-like protein [Micromonospora sp. Llam0]